MKVKNFRDFKKLVESEQNLDEIYIDAQFFYSKNILEHVFKIAISKSIKNAKIFFIHDWKKNSFSHSRSLQNFQINILCQINGKPYGNYIQKNREGFFEVLKPYKYGGSVGIGIPFSGYESEIPLLKEQLKTIPSAVEKINILTSGKATQLQSFEDSRVKIYEYSSSKEVENILYEGEKPNYSEKKNLLFNGLNTDIKIIANTRILFSENFFDELGKSFFEVSTPRIFLKEKTKYRKYLDIGFKTSHSLIKPNLTFSGESIGDNHYKFFRLGEPYLDGACLIFSNVVKASPFDEKYDRGEAEDVAMCNYLSGQGLCIDRINKCIAFTQTNKLKPSWKANLFSHIFNLIN